MGRIFFLTELATTMEKLKNEGKPVILAGGCFDIIHAGHLEFFRKAKDLGGVLMIMLESDESVHRFKGEGRPIHAQIDRAKVLSHLKDVDYVLVMPELKTDREYFDLVKKIEPDIIAVTHGDPLFEKKRKQADEVGGKVIEVIPRRTEYSTTKIIKNNL